MNKVKNVLLKMLLVVAFVAIALLVIIAAPQLSYRLSVLINNEFGSDSVQLPQTGSDNVSNSTDNNSYVKNNTASDLVIQTDTGSTTTLKVGELLKIESILGDSISTDEIENRAITFKKIADNNCLAGQIMKFNGVNWYCDYEKEVDNSTPSVSEVEVAGDAYKVITLVTNSNNYVTTAFNDLNNYADDISFNPATGSLTLGRLGLSDISTNMDGRYSLNTHNHNLSALLDVSIDSIADGEILVWNGSKWVNETLEENGIQALDPDLSALADLSGSGIAVRSGEDTWTQWTLGAGLGLSGSVVNNTDRGSSQYIFKDIADSSGVSQFSAKTNNDAVQFAGAGATSVLFDENNNRVTFTSAGTVYSVTGINGLSGNITSSGNISLGGALTGDTTIANGNFNMVYNLNGSGAFEIQDNGSTALYVDDTGYVGIGTKAPSEKFTVYQGNAAILGSDSLPGAGLRIGYDGSSTNFWVNTISDSVLAIGGTGNVNPASGIININASGAVGIGTTTPATLLDVNGATTFRNNIRLEPFGASSGNTSAILFSELAANGSNYIGIKAPDSLASNIVLTLPTTLPSSSSFLKVNSSGALSWDSATYVTGVTGANGLSGSVTSSGAITLGGTLSSNTVINNDAYNLSLNLNSTGDFSIQDAGTSVLYAADNGLIAIGSGYTSPARLLDINANGVGNNYLRLSYNSSVYTDFYTNSNGELVINPSGSNKRVIIGDGATGKLDVGTVDPLYTVDDETYATYVASMIGVKEEISGVITLSTFDNTQKLYYADLPFAKSKSEELYVFKSICDFGDNWNGLAIVLSADSEGGAWYKKDITDNQIRIYSKSPAEVSYRLTANRFDYKNWDFSKGTDSVSKGFIIE